MSRNRQPAQFFTPEPSADRVGANFAGEQRRWGSSGCRRRLVVARLGAESRSRPRGAGAESCALKKTWARGWPPIAAGREAAMRSDDAARRSAGRPSVCSFSDDRPATFFEVCLMIRRLPLYVDLEPVVLPGAPTSGAVAAHGDSATRGL